METIAEGVTLRKPERQSPSLDQWVPIGGSGRTLPAIGEAVTRDVDDENASSQTQQRSADRIVKLSSPPKSLSGN
jgi:hypothetical protein